MRTRRSHFSRPSDDEDESTSGEHVEGFPLLDPSVKVSPISLFSVSTPCHRRSGKVQAELGMHYTLPSFASLCAEEEFASVAIAWDLEGLWASVTVEQPLERSLFPEVQKGDSVEFFVDTRDSKASGFNNRFCHHFFFLPTEAGGRMAGEITRFRTEDTHEWCDAKELKTTLHTHKEFYRLDIHIPVNCLHGYDPEQFNRLGFTYRINRAGGKPQHFAVCSRDYQIEQQPSLWASLRLDE